MASIMPTGKQQYFNNAGVPLSGGKIYTYAAGTTTPKATYTTAGATVENSNPVVLDARGEATIFWDGSYYVEVKDASDVLVYSIDNYSEPGYAVTALRSDLADAGASTGAAMVGFLQSGTGATSRTVQDRLRDFVTTFDFMTAAQIADVKSGTYTIDCTAAVQAAVNYAIANGIKRVRAPGKGYLINGVASSDTMKNGVLFPFSQVNFDPADQIIFEGDSTGTVFRCGSTSMIMFRMSRNCAILRDVNIDGNSLANTWGVGIVPESMTQTTTLVSQSFCELHNVSRVNLTEGVVFQPGPRVGGSDSGCFYHTIEGGISNNNTRHVYSKKGVTWATDNNRVTRTKFIGQRLTRGNTGYYFDVGSEIDLISCNEELINSGATPLATPTARYITANCSNINFYGGYSESCSKSVDLFASNVRSWGYTPASGSNVAYRTYAMSWADNTDDSSTWTPVLNSSGGGAQGASTSTGFACKQGKIVFISAQISVAKGTLAAGTLSVSGLPFVADPSWTGASFQMLSVPNWSGMTFTASITNLQAAVSGASLLIRKLHSAGAGVVGLTLAECSDPVVFTVQGWYKTA